MKNEHTFCREVSLAEGQLPRIFVLLTSRGSIILNLIYLMIVGHVASIGQGLLKMNAAVMLYSRLHGPGYEFLLKAG